jgi:hypothetical protein
MPLTGDEQPRHLVGDDVWRAEDLGRGEARDAPAGGECAAVAGAIGGESGPVTVVGPAVDLDDEALGGPAEVAAPSCTRLTSGRGIPWSTQSCRNTASTSLRVRVTPCSYMSARIAISAREPRRPTVAASARSTATRSKSSRRSASSTARRSWCERTTAPRSSNVHATVVTGMPRSTVANAGAARADRHGRIPSSLRGRGPFGPTVTSIALPPGGRSPQSAAALRWLSTAPSPPASTAAIQRPSWVSSAWPSV